MFGNLLKRLIYTKTVRSIVARIPNPPSAFASEPLKLQDGSLLTNLKANLPSTKSCPRLSSRVGSVLTQAEIDEAIQKRAGNPRKWTINRLCKRYNASRSFVIHRILSSEEREAEWQREQERVEGLSMNRKKGLLVRYLTRQDRFRSW
jgi:hypothetical protein